MDEKYKLATESEHHGLSMDRRHFLRYSLLGGFGIVSGLTTWAAEGNHILYKIENLSREKPKPKLATLLLAKLLNPETDSWLIGAGTLITPYHIITTKHLGVNADFQYSFEEDYRQAFRQGASISHNIEDLITHPEVDLTIMRLKHPNESVQPAQICRQTTKLHGPLTVVLTNRLMRDEQYAGTIGGMVNYDLYGNQKPDNAYIIIGNDAVSEGDSGSGLYLESSEELVGVVQGGLKSVFFGLNPKTFYVNLTQPSIREWIDQQTH